MPVNPFAHHPQRRLKRLTYGATALGLALSLSACAGGFDGFEGLVGGSQSAQGARVQPVGATTLGGVPIQQLRADQLCPSILVRDGTETLRLYAGEDRTPNNVTYQAQILQTVVECTPGADQIALSIGVAGRALIGPQGNPASLDLPIRLVVLDTRTGDVYNSELQRVPAIIEPPEVSAVFTLVNRSFVIPMPQNQSDYRVEVGFDEGS